jgi:hypothetical protein
MAQQFPLSGAFKNIPPWKVRTPPELPPPLESISVNELPTQLPIATTAWPGNTGWLLRARAMAITWLRKGPL